MKYFVGMILTALALLFISPNLWASVDKTCLITTTARIGSGTTQLWNFDVTGADLVRHEKLFSTAASFASVGIIEDGFELGAVPPKNIGRPLRTNLKLRDGVLGDETVHGTEVASLIFNPEVSISPPGRIAAFTSRPCDFLSGWTPADTEYHQDHYQGSPVRIRCDMREAISIQRMAGSRIINLSGALGSWKQTEEVFRGSSAILVTSAGNDPHDPQYPTESLKFRVPAIVVGTLRLDGSRGGSYGHAIDILAPSVTPAFGSADGEDGDGPQFGLTSGATAFVTSGLTGAMSFLPEMNLSIAERLLKETGIDNQSDRKLINIYKFIRTAKRIRDRLEELKRTHTVANIESLLNSEAKMLLDFTHEANESLRLAEQLIDKHDCVSLQERARLLRKAFFLNPSNSNRIAVSRYYQSLVHDPRSELEQHYQSLSLFFLGLNESTQTRAIQHRTIR